MTLNLATASIKARSHVTSRQLGDHLGDVINVKGMGATGDGETDDTAAIQAALDLAFGTTGSPHGNDYYLNRPVFFPAGRYKITAPLTVRSVRGGHIFGAGRLATSISQVTANTSAFVTNGFDYSRVEGMSIGALGSGIGFDLDWNDTGTVALQANTFSDILFGSSATGIGTRVGNYGAMGSENTFLNCHWTGNLTGLKICNYNALQMSVIGGNFQGNTIAIWVTAGSCPIIHGVGFQSSSDTDIAVDNTAGDCYSVVGCRSESTNFCRFHNGASAQLSCCTQTAGANGVFAFIEGGSGVYPGSLGADFCYSVNGKFTGNGYLYIRGNGSGDCFQNAAYKSGFAGTVVQDI